MVLQERVVRMQILEIKIQSSAPCNVNNIIISASQITNSIYDVQKFKRSINHYFGFNINLTPSVQSEIDCLIKRTNNQVNCAAMLSDNKFYPNCLFVFNGSNYELRVY